MKGKEQVIKTYAMPDFKDYYATESEGMTTDLALSASKGASAFRSEALPDADPEYPLDMPIVTLKGEMRGKDATPIPVTLVPFGTKNAQLRRVTFPIAHDC